MYLSKGRLITEKEKTPCSSMRRVVWNCDASRIAGKFPGSERQTGVTAADIKVISPLR
jgi:hypothetical protein